MSFILNLFKKTRRANITIAGLDQAGKTAFINYLLNGSFTETTPTAGVNREVINLPKLQISAFDLGGQEKFRVMWPQVNERSNGLIYVIDSTDHTRYEQTLSILYDVLEGQVNDLIPVLVLLHKHDLDNRIEITQFLESTKLSNYNIKWACFETSAKTGAGIIDAMTWFIKELEDNN